MYSRKDNTTTYTSIILTVAGIIAGAMGLLTYFYQANVDVAWRIIGITAYAVAITATFLAVRRHLKHREVKDYRVSGSYGADNYQSNSGQPRRKTLWDFWKVKGYRYDE